MSDGPTWWCPACCHDIPVYVNPVGERVWAYHHTDGEYINARSGESVCTTSGKGNGWLT